VRLGIQIADAVHTAHDRGILHRDLKPANVLVTPAGAVKFDFGIARSIAADQDETQTAVGAVAGTPAYMSPEQLQGTPLDARSDVFSFGAVLYEMVSGRPAFRGETPADVLSAVLRDRPDTLASSPLAQIVGRCLEKNAALRYQTMADGRAALENASEIRSDTRSSIAALVRVGEAQRAAAVVREFRGSPEPLWGMVLYHLYCGDVDAAADWWEKSIARARAVRNRVRELASSCAAAPESSLACIGQGDEPAGEPALTDALLKPLTALCGVTTMGVLFR
jgi:hypothetical protein